jgi:hypothetical protein
MSLNHEGLDWIPFTPEVFDNLQPNDRTGFSIDIVPQYNVNNTVVTIGRPYYSTMSNANVGAVSIYTFDSGNQQWNLKGDHIIGTNAEERFGSSVCMNKDADCLAIGGPGYDNNRGATYAFLWDGV